MSTATGTTFWNLLNESRLLPKERLQGLYQGFQQSGTSAEPASAARWLVEQRALTQFQAQLLLTGKPGPFYFGEYLLTDVATSGRLRGIYRAVHVPTGNRVWLSFFSGLAITSPPHWQALTQWTALVLRAESPALHRVEEIVDLGDCKFCVLEEMPGQTFEAFAHSGKNPATQSAGMIRQAAIGVAALHAAGVLHGAIRPENLWFDPQARTKLLHFPLSRDPLGPQVVVDDSTIDYLAPELVQPNAVPTVGSDIYALGCVLYQLIAGRPVFAGTRQEKLAAHASQAPAEIRDIPGVSDSLQQVLFATLDKNPAARFQQAGQLVEALAPLSEPSMLQIAASKENPARTAYEQMIAPRRALGASTAESMANVSGTAVPNGPPTVGSAPQSSHANGGKATVANPTALAPTGNGAPVVQSKSTGTDSDSGEPRGPLDFWHNLGRSRRNLIIVASTTVVTGLILLMLLNILSGPSDPPIVEGPPSDQETPEVKPPSPISPPIAPVKPAEMGIADDGKTIWMAPTLGGPFQVKYLAPGVQMVMFLRPAELLTMGEGRRVFASLGPAGESIRAWVQQSTGLALEEIERLDVAFYDPVGEQIQIQMVVYPVTPRAEADMLAKWGNPVTKVFSGAKFHEARGWAYFTPTTDGSLFIVGDADKVRDVVEFRDAPVRMRGQMEQLIAESDNFYQLCVVFSQNYIRSQRDTLYPGRLAPLREAVDWTLGPSREIEAGMLSFFLDPEQAIMFSELRLFGTRDSHPRNIAQQIYNRIGMSPTAMKDHLKTLQISPYSRDLLWDSPDMLEFVHDNTRFDRDERQSILRAYLPMYAAHNLAMASDLALLETGGTVASAAGPTNVPQKTIHEKLKAPTSLVFARDTLEQSLNLLSSDIGVKIEIIGNDLKLAGITKNQSFAISERNKPAEEILQQILFLANPDKTTKSIADPTQKLVYAIKEKYEGGEDAVIVTTREQATKRGDQLPAAFGTGN